MDKTRPVIQKFSKSWRSKIYYLILSLVGMITLYEVGLTAITLFNQSFQTMGSISLSCNSCGGKIEPDPNFSPLPDKLLNDPGVQIDSTPRKDVDKETWVE